MIFMNMDFGPWFYNYYRYLKGKRDGKESFNSTRFIDTMERFRKVTELFNSQPYGIVGNTSGFEKLIDLMTRSNYTFEDINDALIKTYKANLQNAMGRMTVNTHSSIFHCNSNDSKYVTSDKLNVDYRIIDVPFDQLHFGNRDEFIRQKLEKVHHRAYNNYVHISEFTGKEIQDLIGFSIMITCNGRISNDWYIAFNELGFLFKVGWRNVEDVDFIIYMLDDSSSYKTVVPFDILDEHVKIPNTYFEDLLKYHNVSGMKCFVDIYDPSFTESTCVLPSIGQFDNNGNLDVIIQPRLLNEMNEIGTKKAMILIYTFKYIHEVPNLYPAVNFYDIMETKKVYTDTDNPVVNEAGKTILSTKEEITPFEVCTPPIILDRSTSSSYVYITNGLNLKDDMMQYAEQFSDIGRVLSSNNIDEDKFNEVISTIRNGIILPMYGYYMTYVKCAILTSFIPYKNVNRFMSFIDNLNKFAGSSYENYQLYTFDELFSDNYSTMVEELTKPFEDEMLKPFRIMTKLRTNYFDELEEFKGFNRPISEHLFISLRYDRESESWLFDYPNIRHFNGISNTFYVRNDLKGDEIFKFFILYSDSDNADMVDKYVEPFGFDEVFDFDKFCVEAEKHMGYIRYWHNENKLMKLSEIICGRYDSETSANILSKILKRKVDGEDILSEYPSDILYDTAGMSTYVTEYDKQSEEAPFAINYLFYTVNMMYENQDKLQTYFFRRLINDKFLNSYADIDIREAVMNNKHTNKVNFSEIHSFPKSFNVDSSMIPLDNVQHVFENIPMVIQNKTNVLSSPYEYVFNEYDTETEYHMLADNNKYFLKFTNLNGYRVRSYKNDAMLCKLVTFYLTEVYDCLNTILNDYDKHYSTRAALMNHIRNFNSENGICNKILDFGNGKTFENNKSQNVIEMIYDDNIFTSKINQIYNELGKMDVCKYESRNISVSEFINKNVIGTIRFVYKTNGFVGEAYPYIRNLYKHLKKYNSKQNLYEYNKWISGVDVKLLRDMDKYISKNENYNLPADTFLKLGYALEPILSSIKERVTRIQEMINELNTEIKTDHIDVLIEYVNEVKRDNIFDMYVIDEIKAPKEYNLTYTVKPHIGIITLDVDVHFKIPNVPTAGETSLVFKIDSEYNNSTYDIKSFDKIAEYIIFNGEPINCVMKLLDDSGNQISEIPVTITFTKVSSSADVLPTFDQLSYAERSMLDFENNHDTYEINEDKKIVNNVFSNMNYELMIGNRFLPLQHTTEMILHEETFMPGAIDRVCVPNEIVNRFANSNHGRRSNNKMYFKPSRVIHPNVSVGGKYFVGQRLYLQSEDGFIFPTTVTNIDHSLARGFMEVEVDKMNSKWFEVDDSLVEKYLTTDVLCHVIDDNISNLLDEYSDPTIFEGLDMKHLKYIDRIYLSHRDTYTGQNKIKINMISHNFNGLSDAEMYPVLRTEPNDHDIWNTELAVFKTQKDVSQIRKNNQESMRFRYQEQLKNTKDLDKRRQIIYEIEKCDYEIKYEEDLQKRIDTYIEQLESPTTWYNVHNYDSTLIYITNGRAQSSVPYRREDIREIPYTDKLKVSLYNYDLKEWIPEDKFTVTPEIVDHTSFDEKGDYEVDNVLYSLNIEILDESILGHIDIFFGYKSADVFEEIEKHDNTCYTRFKPILSLSKPVDEYDPYDCINIRKHMNGKEVYKFDSLETIEGFSKRGFHIKRVDMNGKYNSPPLRLCDVEIVHDGNSYGYNDITLWIKNPIKDVNINESYKTKSFSGLIYKPIDYFESGESVKVKLICIQNKHFSGNFSDVMFDAVISYNGEQQTIEVTDTNLSISDTGTYTCTVLKDDEYKPLGGVIDVTYSVITDEVMDTLQNWIRVPEELCKYRIIPKELIITLNSSVVINEQAPFYIGLKSEYYKDYEDEIMTDNSNDYNPYEYYYDKRHNIRYPISDIRTNNINKRLVISGNDDVSIIKANYIGVCRYSLNRIPKNGIINLTGYIPTPLSRERYQFWVNGEDKTNSPDLHIISPSSIQFTNLTSLRNFELIELVYDYDDTMINRKGNVYIGLNGETYSSYKLALRSRTPIVSQNIQFMFNSNNHTSLQDNTKSIINNPNNVDIDTDILSYIETVDEVTSYEELYNTPSINGVLLKHPSITSLGFVESSNDDILKMFNNVWKLEALTNPMFNISHNTRDMVNRKLRIHVKHNPDSTCDEDYYVAYVTGIYDDYYTMYVSKSATAGIADTDNTLKIIGYIRNGVQVLLNKSFLGKYVHVTIKNVESVMIK